MKRLFQTFAALLFALAATTASAAPQHGCARGAVRLKHGGCASAHLRPDIVPPPIRYCLGGGTADALGRCPSRIGHEQRRRAVCANGRTPNALGQCGLENLCTNGEVAVNGLCPPLAPCSGGACGFEAPTPDAAVPLRGTAHPVEPQIAPHAVAPNFAPAVAAPVLPPRP